MSLATPDPWNSVAEGYDALVRPALSTFASAALELASVQAQSRVLDVATGPGTLPLLASPRVRRVVAVDFSEEMLRLCRHNTAGLANVDVQFGDGQDLAFDQEFDAAFSMFGLIFYPDRAAGYAALHRALVANGVAVVSAWPRPERSSAMVSAIGAMGAAFPDAPEPPPPADPLQTAAQLQAELEAAGFVDVEVEESEHRFSASVEEVWRGVADGFAPLAHARRTMPADVWQAAHARGLAWLTANHDPADELEYVALLGRGRRA